MSIFVASNCSASPGESWCGLCDLCQGGFQPWPGRRVESWVAPSREAKHWEQGSLGIPAPVNPRGELHPQVVSLLAAEYR